MKLIIIGITLMLWFITLPLNAEPLTVAAAADLKFAMEEIATAYRTANPSDTLTIIYGSSGKFATQIRQGAPFDLYFSADISYPQALEKEGFAGSAVTRYARGRIVLWSASVDAQTLTLKDLPQSRFKRIAIANPKHAPYGKRAEEALRNAGVWERIASRLVYGENIAQTAQFVMSGNAQIGVIALSLALSPEYAKQRYYLIPDTMHEPLDQGFIITRRAVSNTAARRFAQYMNTQAVRTILNRYGFLLPEPTSAR